MEDKNIDFVLPVEREDLKSKKKITYMAVISVAIVMVIIITLALSFLLPKSVTGSWELTVNPELAESTDDQIEERDRVYYIFEKPNRYGEGEWRVCYDGGVEHYKYELLEKDGVKKINLGSIDLEYKITGSKLLGTAKMKLVYPEQVDEATGEKTEAQEYILEQDREPKYSKDSYKDYDIDDSLLGEWATNERSLSYFYYNIPYVETVEFNDNGVMSIHYESEELALDRYMYYSYTAKDNKLIFSLVTDKDTKFEVSYEFDKDGNLKFIDDATSGSIFADQFFGDVTFYTLDKLPEPSEATGDEILAE